VSLTGHTGTQEKSSTQNMCIEYLLNIFVILQRKGVQIHILIFNHQVVMFYMGENGQLQNIIMLTMQYKPIKISILIILCLHLAIMMQAQSFVYRLNNPQTRVFTYPSIEFENYYYVPYYESTVTNSNKRNKNNIHGYFNFNKQIKSTDGLKVLKINKQATHHEVFIVDTFDIENDIMLFELKSRNNYIEMFGTCKNKYTDDLSVFSILLDADFNMISRKSTLLPDNRADHLMKALANNPEVTYMVMMGKASNGRPYVSLAELDSNFILQQFLFFDTLQFFFPINIKIVEFDTCFILAEYYQSLMYRISKNDFTLMDTIDKTIGHYPTSYSFFQYSDSTFLNPQEYSPIQISWPFDSTWGVIMIERNIDLNTIDSLVFFSSDTSQMAGITSIDMKTPDSLFFAGAYNSTLEYIYANFDNWLMVYNINWGTKEINWVKYYGGDAFYYCFHLLATSDGGCLVSAGFHDWRVSSEWDFDLFLLKLDANGHVLSDKSYLPNKETLSFTLYPNPSTDYMRLHFEKGLKLEQLRYSIYDVAGKKHISMSVNFSSNELLINTSGLSAGIYFLVVENSDNLNLRIPFVKQ